MGQTNITACRTSDLGKAVARLRSQYSIAARGIRGNLPILRQSLLIVGWQNSAQDSRQTREVLLAVILSSNAGQSIYTPLPRC